MTPDELKAWDDELQTFGPRLTTADATALHDYSQHLARLDDDDLQRWARTRYWATHPPVQDAPSCPSSPA
jgi:hypothetical protein